MNERHVKKQELIDHLTALGNGHRPPELHREYGLCHDLYRHFKIHGLHEAFWWNVACDQWEHYTGNPDLPVPNDDPALGPHTDERRRPYTEIDDKWGDHHYGNRRREFCLHLADWLKRTETTVFMGESGDDPL